MLHKQEEKQSLDNIPEEVQTLEAAIINMFKELKESMSKELQESMISQQIRD